MTEDEILNHIAEIDATLFPQGFCEAKGLSEEVLRSSTYGGP
jgi:hypothetical protein